MSFTRFSSTKYPLKWLLRDLAALNIKLWSNTQSKEPIQLNEHNVDPRQRSMGTVGQLRDMLEFIFLVSPVMLIILYKIIDYFIIPLNDLAFAIARYSFL
jgi:hypothetical protein